MLQWQFLIGGKNKMQIKELIEKLKEVAAIEPNSTVWLTAGENIYHFTGFRVVDDVCDVELYVAAGDKGV